MQRRTSDSQKKRGKASQRPRSGRHIRGACNSVKLTPDNCIRKSSGLGREGTLCRPRGWLCSCRWENSSTQSTPSDSWQEVRCWGEAETAGNHPAMQRDRGRLEKQPVQGTWCACSPCCKPPAHVCQCGGPEGFGVRRLFRILLVFINIW